MAGCVSTSNNAPEVAAPSAFYAKYVDQNDQEHEFVLERVQPMFIANEQRIDAVMLEWQIDGVPHANLWLDDSFRLIRYDFQCPNPERRGCVENWGHWSDRIFPSILGLDMPLGFATQGHLTYQSGTQQVNITPSVSRHDERTVYQLSDDLPPSLSDHRGARYTFTNLPFPVEVQTSNRNLTLERYNVGGPLGPVDTHHLPLQLTQTPKPSEYFPGDDEDVMGVGLTPRAIIDSLIDNDRSAGALWDEGCLTDFEVFKSEPNPGSQVAIRSKIADGMIAFASSEAGRSWTYTLYETLTGPELAFSEGEPYDKRDCDPLIWPTADASEFQKFSISAMTQASEFILFDYARMDVVTTNQDSPGGTNYYITAFRPSYLSNATGTFSYHPYEIRWNADTDRIDYASMDPDDLARLDAGYK